MSALVVAYLAVGVLAGAVSCVFMGPLELKYGERPSVLARGLVLHEHRYRADFRSRLRWFALHLLPVPLLSVCWPYAAVQLVRAVEAEDQRKQNAALELAPSILGLSMTTLGFAAALLALRTLHGPGWAVDLGAVFLLASLLAGLATALGGPDLGTVLRRNLMRPYVQFLLIAAADYASLLAGALLLGPLRAGQPLTPGLVVDEATGLATFTHAVHAVTTAPRSPVGVLLTVTGIAYFATVGKLVMRYRQFVRKPADHALIVSRLCVAGRFRAARAWLEGLDGRLLGHTDLLVPRALVMLGYGRFDKAYELTETVFRLNADAPGMTYATRTPDDVTGRLLDMAGLVDLGGADNRRLLDYVIDKGLSDGQLAFRLGPLLDPWEVGYVPDVDHLGFTDDRMPIAHALAVLLLTRDTVARSEARRRLRLAATRSPSATDRICALVADVREGLVDGDDVRATHERLLTEITGAPVLPAWCRMGVAVTLVQFEQDPALAGRLTPRVRECETALLAGALPHELATFRSATAAVARLPVA